MRPTVLLRRRAVVPVLLAALGLAAGGCSLFFDAPEVRIADVRVSGIGLSGATADVALEVTNPNGFDLTAEALRYRLEFEDPADAGAADADAERRWHTVAAGESDRRLTVEADRRAVVTVEVPFEYSDLGRAVLGLLERGEITYRLTGDVLFDAPLGGVRVPFEDTGRVGL